MKKTSTNGGFPGGTLLGKLLAVLLAAHLFLPVTAQNRKPVSVNVQNATIEHVISTLKTQYGFSFVIPSDEIDLTRRVTLNLQQRPIDEVLGILFADQPVHIEFLGRNVIRISRKIEPPASTLVSGRVVDEQQQPIIGASVVVPGTTIGVSTDIEGRFSIDPGPNRRLRISYIGYATQEVSIPASQTTLEITLRSEETDIENIVVVGYTPMRKSDFTGAIASVKASELSTTTATVGQSLAGRIAGVEVRQTSGAPGDGVQIRIRGVNSFSASSEPLYVIDGYPASEDVYINPGDIESIDVLKDAASAAIYGSRGASGVVLITTKRGSAGQTRVSYDFTVGIQQVERKLELLNAVQFRDLLIEARNSSYRTKALAAGLNWSPYDDNSVRTAKGFSLSEVGIPEDFFDFTTGQPVTPAYDTDWQDAIFSNALTMRHNVQVSGGKDFLAYMVSVGYLSQEGIIDPSDHTRTNVRVNLDAKVTKKLTLQTNFSMYDVQNREVSAAGRWINDGVIQSALMMLPGSPVYNADGSYATGYMIGLSADGWGINGAENPVALAHELDIRSKSQRTSANATLNFEVIEGLNLKANLGMQFYNYRYNYYRPRSIGRNSDLANSAGIETYVKAESQFDHDVDRLGEFTANYKKEFGRHRLDLLAGYTMQKKTYDREVIEATGMADDRIHEITAHGSAASDVTISSSTRKASWTMLSYLARVNYAFDDRYVITGTFRADGSSKFGPDNRWGYFPSISAGWTLSNEPWLKNLFGNDTSLKLRASWGLSGNNDIGNYEHLAVLESGGYAEGSSAGAAYWESSFTDGMLGWETTSQVNVGVDLSLFRGRFNLIANFYDSRTRDLLYTQPVSGISGSTSVVTNVDGALLRNRGVDLQIDARLLTGAVKWNVSGNISFNRNKVLSLGSLEDIYSVGERSVTSYVTRVGLPIGSFFGYQVNGIISEADMVNIREDAKYYDATSKSFPEGYRMKGPAVPSYSAAEAGDVLWADTNSDGVIDENDRTVLGNAYPKFTAGFNTSLSWKNIDLGVVLTGSYGASVINFQKYYLYNMEGSSNQLISAMDRYHSDSDPGRNNVFRAARHSTTNVSQRISSQFVDDASYLRISNISLGYTFPQRLISKLRMQQLRIYASIDNVWTFTDYEGYNPEVSYKSSNLLPGFDWGCYPLSRTYSLGVRITF